MFLRATAREVRPFLGDTSCFHLIDSLGAGPRPLASYDDGLVHLTVDGRRVLDGADDRLTLIGIDRWIGGVHLVGPAPAWRWHESLERLASADSARPQ